MGHFDKRICRTGAYFDWPGPPVLLLAYTFRVT
jgi:hypothetical protein